MNHKIHFLKLIQATDPLFPIGSFTLSNGMETYVQKGIITDQRSLLKFLNSYLSILTFNDLGFAAKAANGVDFVQLDELCVASKVPYEIRLGSQKLCQRFLKTETALGEQALLEEYLQKISEQECGGCHCIAVGLLIRDMNTDVEQALSVYSYSLLSAMVNHAVKLIPLRQLEGQAVLSKVMEKIPQSVYRAIQLKVEDLGACGCGLDLRCMQHEVLYSRVYIS